MSQSTTRAARYLQLMHTNDDFASTILLGVSQDDSDTVQSALDILGVDGDSLNLTDDEMTAFCKGVTPSGALDIATWEGYYVSDPLANGDKYALLIAGSNNTMYWGLENVMINNLGQYGVSYQLGTDGSVSFSTSNGDVKIFLTRTYDVDTADVDAGTFKGTFGSETLTGTQTVPPIPTSDPSTNLVRAAVKSTTFVTLTTEVDSDEPWYMSDFMQSLGGVMNIVGTITLLIKVPQWIHKIYVKQTTKPPADDLAKILTDKQAVLLAIAARKLTPPPPIDWNSQKDTFTTKVTEDVNQKLTDANVTPGPSNVDTVVGQLNIAARTSLQSALTDYASGLYSQSYLLQSDAFKELQNQAKWATDLANSDGSQVAQVKFDSLVSNSADMFEGICKNVVYTRYKTDLDTNYTEAQVAAAEAQTASNDANNLVQTTTDAINALDATVNGSDKAAADAAKTRQDELNKELSKQVQDAKDKADALADANQKVLDLDGDRTDAENKSDNGETAWRNGIDGI